MSFVRIVDLGIIISTILNFSKTIENIIEILIELLKTRHLNDFKVLFDLKSVKDAMKKKLKKVFIVYLTMKLNILIYVMKMEK